MKNKNNTSVVLAAATVLGLSFFSASNADAQWYRGGHSGYNTGYQSQSSCSQRDNLRGDVMTIDNLAQQMTRSWAYEVRRGCGCRDSVALLNHMQNYTRDTQNLVRAYNGTCKTTFKKAACKVRETLTCVQKQSRRVRNLSCSVKGMIEQSCPIATRIHRNADRFNPVSYSRNSGYNNGPRHSHSNRGHSRNQSPASSIFGSILRSAIYNR